MAELTEEQIAEEKRFMKGIPRVNAGALIMPAIWGPAHGQWAAILYYPIWLFADNCFYAAYSVRSAASILIGLVVLVLLVAITVAYSILGQPAAWHRAAAAGKTREQYLKAERIWAVASCIIGVAMLCFATFYNVSVRPGLAA